MLVLLLVGLSSAGAGCGDPISSEVKELLGEVNSHLEKAKSATMKLEEFKRGWAALEKSEQVTEQMVAQAVTLLNNASESLTTAIEELKEAGKTLLTIKRMRVSEEMKEYAGMKNDAISEQEKMLELGLRAMAVRAQALSEPESEDLIERLEEYERQIIELEEEALEHATRAQTLHIDANDYYDEKVER